MLDQTPPATQPTRYRLSEDVLLVPAEDGTARLLNLNGQIYALSGIGAAMIQQTIDHGREAAVAGVARRHDADPAQVGRDLDELLADLERQGLLCRSDRRPALHHLRMALAALLLAILTPVIRHSGHTMLQAWVMLAAARVSFKCFRWTATLESWERFWRLGSSGSGVEASVADAIDRIVRRTAAGHWFRVECKERSLCCWALARSAGLPADLVVGVQFYPFAGHCWCETGRRMLSDDRTRIEKFEAVVRYT